MTTPTFASGVIVGWYFVVIKMQLLTAAKIAIFWAPAALFLKCKQLKTSDTLVKKVLLHSLSYYYVNNLGKLTYYAVTMYV